MTFECQFHLTQKLPFRMQGDCPVVITSILSPIQIDQRETEIEGRAIESSGPMAEWLRAFGLFPAIGDVVVAVNGMTVTQLNSNQVKRFIKRIRKGISSHIFRDNPNKFTVTFRRHFLEVIAIYERDFLLSILLFHSSLGLVSRGQAKR